MPGRRLRCLDPNCGEYIKGNRPEFCPHCERKITPEDLKKMRKERAERRWGKKWRNRAIGWIPRAVQDEESSQEEVTPGNTTEVPIKEPSAVPQATDEDLSGDTEAKIEARVEERLAEIHERQMERVTQESQEAERRRFERQKEKIIRQELHLRGGASGGAVGLLVTIVFLLFLDWPGSAVAGTLAANALLGAIIMGYQTMTARRLTGKPITVTGTIIGALIGALLTPFVILENTVASVPVGLAGGVPFGVIVGGGAGALISIIAPRLLNKKDLEDIEAIAEMEAEEYYNEP